MKRFLNALVASSLSLALVLLGLPAHAQKISADPTASALAGGEFLAGVQSGANVKVLPSQILTYSLANFHSVNAQTGTTYTYVAGDRGKLVTHSNASAIAGTLPQATGSFASGWFMWVQNRGVGALTITPTTSTIDGAATLVLAQNQGVFVISDGTNYFTQRGLSASAGLSNFTDTLNSSSPNATIPVAILTATNAASDVDIALKPKGTGSLSRDASDGTATGGNKRGTGATDWQYRPGGLSSYVASGTASTISGGNQQTGNGNYSTISGGQGNTASTTFATVVGGNSNTSSGTGSTSGGDSVTVSGNYATGFGRQLTVAGVESAAFGAYATTRGVLGPLAHGIAGATSSIGARQSLHYLLTIATTNATPTIVTANGSGTASATNQIILASSSVLCVRGQLVVRNTTSGDAGKVNVDACAKNVAGTVSLSGTPVIGTYLGDAALNTIAVTAVADNTNKALQITFTGIAATNISALFEGWTSEVQ